MAFADQTVNIMETGNGARVRNMPWRKRDYNAQQPIGGTDAIPITINNGSSAPFQPCSTTGTFIPYIINGVWTCLAVSATGDKMLVTHAEVVSFDDIPTCPS